MSFGQINNMNEISNTSTIMSIIVVSEDTKLWCDLVSDSHDEWHQIIWNIFWAFANQTGWICTDWVEVSQCDCAKLLFALAASSKICSIISFVLPYGLIGPS